MAACQDVKRRSEPGCAGSVGPVPGVLEVGTQERYHTARWGDSMAWQAEGHFHELFMGAPSELSRPKQQTHFPA